MNSHNLYDFSLSRFDDIIKRHAREDLFDRIKHGEYSFHGGKVKIQAPRIEIPRFEHLDPYDEGVGEGKGNIGDIIKEQEGELEEKKGAGTGSGEHEIGIDEREVAEMLMENLELPRIKPKQAGQITEEVTRYTSNRRYGAPLSRRYTFVRAFKRTIASGQLDPKKPFIQIRHTDRRYVAPKIVYRPSPKAVVYYMMDVSGSMGYEERKTAKHFCNLVDIWLKYNYQNRVERKYIVHDTRAGFVSEDKFYRSIGNWGTFVTSAYRLLKKTIFEETPPQEYNIYTFHLTDGEVFDWDFWWIDPEAVKEMDDIKEDDNISEDKDSLRTSLIIKSLLPFVNQIASIQIETKYGMGDLNDKIEGNFEYWYTYTPESLLLTSIETENREEEVMEAIKYCFSGGK